ncbi:hypothetical protein C8R43DRAFT_494687 [Mycena crocata]|nr:hypothetical protein C8R43DRAFT_494687 [Mycena crocata]
MYWHDDPEGTAETASMSAGSSTPPSPCAAPIRRTAWPALQSQTTKEVLQSVLKVRKSWKTLRGGETVWPLELEAALLEGLENYQPDDSRETRMLGRFPRRNRFISDYIFEKTGKRRSAKQVGSRLQQLRESCGGKKLLHLLSPFRQPSYSESSASSDSSCTSPVFPFAGEHPFRQTSSARHTAIYIDILPEGAPDHGSNIVLPLSSDDGEVVHASDRPRPLESINPLVTFLSPIPLLAQSHFTVYSESLILHAESVPLTPVTEAVPQEPGFLYSTALIPEYWKIISVSPDPTRFTICQEVVKHDNNSIAFLATYKFRYPSQFSSDLQVPSPHPSHAHTETPSRISAVSMDHKRYPLYVAPDWDSTVRSRENSPTQGYHGTSPHSDSSACFPSALSNYVSFWKFRLQRPL